MNREGTVKQTVVPWIGGVGLVTMIGCAGTGAVIPIHLHGVAPSTEKVAVQPQPVRVAIGPFEDGRRHQTGLGVRTHLWGGVSYFDVPGSKLTEAITQALREHLVAKGWQVVSTEGGDQRDGKVDVDVILTGRVEDCAVHAKSGFGFTEITARARMVIQAANTADGSAVRMVLNGTGTENVFWFEAEDVEAVINGVLADSFSRLMQDTTVDQRRLRLKASQAIS
ncbi:MAG: YajG family lipoprotein [Nitrospira sp.]|nr:YajG family lipoprotein [Nitrospira sp.]MCP9442718.1 YajG family lipoprotein [Nitrospira sp.]